MASNTIEVDAKKLLEAGAHFGHKTSRWHPAMRPYIHSKRGDTHIIDLTKTAPALETALEAISQAVAKGGKVLLVSTKRQAKDTVQALAEEASMPYVVNRWLGGMLTNQKTIGERVKYLKKQEERMASGELASKYNKLEVQNFQEEIDDMNELYAGIKEMPAKPALVVVIDILHDKNAVAEATKLHIPVVGLVDTNGDPRTTQYPVPCNDDALKTIEVVCDYIKQAIEAGKAAQKKAPEVSVAKSAVKVESMHDKLNEDKAAPKAAEAPVSDKKPASKK